MVKTLHTCKCSKTFDKKYNYNEHVKICNATKVIEELETKLKDAETKNQSLVDALIGKAPDSQSNQLLEMLSRKDTMIREKDAEIARLNQQLQCSGQTNVNITNNVTVNIVFGKESLDHIRPVDVLELMEKRSPKSVAAFIKMIYEDPSNLRSIQKPNLSRPHYLVFRGGGFVHEHQETFLRELYRNSEEKMTNVAKRGTEELEEMVNKEKTEREAELKEEQAREEEELRMAMQEAERLTREEFPHEKKSTCLFQNATADNFEKLKKGIIRKRKPESQTSNELKKRKEQIHSFEKDVLSKIKKGMELTDKGFKPNQPKDRSDEGKIDKPRHDTKVDEYNHWKEYAKEAEMVLNDILRPNRK